VADDVIMTSHLSG